MTNVNVYLRENLGNISVAPRIDEKGLNNAVQAFAFIRVTLSVVPIENVYTQLRSIEVLCDGQPSATSSLSASLTGHSTRT